MQVVNQLACDGRIIKTPRQAAMIVLATICFMMVSQLRGETSGILVMAYISAMQISNLTLQNSTQASNRTTLKKLEPMYRQ